MGGPEDARLALALGRLGLHVQRRVPAPGVDAHHAHAELVEPVRRLGGDAGALDHVVGRVEERVAAGADQDDVERLDVAVERGERVVDLGDRDRVAVGLVRRSPGTTPGAWNHSSGSSSIVCARSPAIVEL